VRFHFEDGQAWERQVTFREPVSSVERMLLAIRPKIESAIASGALAPCTEIGVSLLDVCGENVSQLHLFPSQRARSAVQEERMAEAARQLKARYGRPVLARILEVEPWSRIPERRFALIDYDP
jgi:DNA polymerase-4/protein ImuB